MSKQRFYFHGDKRGTEYYCCRCDAFVDSRHDHLFDWEYFKRCRKADKKLLKAFSYKWFRPLQAPSWYD